MFYVIRIVLIIILVLSARFAIRRYIKRVKKTVAKGEKYTKRKFYAIYLSIPLSAILLSALSFIPFEASFIRFDTVEDALKYKWIDTQYLTIHYEDDCAFAVRGTTEIYAFDRNEDGFGLVNHHSKKFTYREIYDNDLSFSVLNTYAVYQKDANKTFYLLNYQSGDRKEDVIQSDVIDLKYFAHPLYEKNNYGWFGYTNVFGSVYQDYDVATGEPLEIFDVSFEGISKTFVLKKPSMGVVFYRR